MAAIEQKAEGSVETVAAEEVTAKRFTVKDIFYDVTLEELVSRGMKFNIVGHSKENYSVFDLMAIETSQDDFFHLMEDINELVKYKETKFKKKPKVWDVVLAKKPGLTGYLQHHYHRCIITEIVFDTVYYASVYWIDVGGAAVVEMKDLKPVDKDIMSHPRLAYTVILEDGFQINNYILLPEFVKAMRGLRNKEFSVKFGAPSEMGGHFYCPKKVKLMYKDSSNTIVDLQDEVNKLKKWEWETFSNLIGNDDEIYEKGKWGRGYRSNFKDQLPFPYVLTPKVDRFSATVSRVATDKQDAKFGALHLILLDNHEYYNFFNVLHHQLERYTASINKSKFFPAINEPVLFKLDDKKEYKKKVKCLGRWLRAIRIDKELLYLFDVDDYVPFQYLPENDYEMRPLYHEFFKVPALSMVVRPTNVQGAVEFAAAKEIFKVGERFHFIVTKDTDGTGSPYEVQYSKVVKESEKKLTVANFLTTYGN